VSSAYCVAVCSGFWQSPTNRDEHHRAMALVKFSTVMRIANTVGSVPTTAAS